jgi:hypothetical protein
MPITGDMNVLITQMRLMRAWVIKNPALQMYHKKTTWQQEKKTMTEITLKMKMKL